MRPAWPSGSRGWRPSRPPPAEPDAPPALNDEQRAALAQIEAAGPGTTLLHGVTGSGKTEVYLHAASRVLEAGRQVLVLVPEINLTPQLEARFAERFAGRVLVTLHSGLTPAQRLRHWLLAHLGRADLVLGTRLAVFASLPRLGLIVVDEEHDPSLQAAGGRALFGARPGGVPGPAGAGGGAAGLGHAVAGELAACARAALSQRGARAPHRRRRAAPPAHGGHEHAAARARGRRRCRRRSWRRSRGASGAGEQSLVFLNRRGYAPVLHCTACGWKSGCPHCSAWRVFHKGDRSLRCHHCGLAERVPRACPECGNLDIQPIGRGTERLEEQLALALPEARLARIDADSTRAKGALQARLAAVHAGEVDILVGTQMVAKGHDFRRITLVAAVNPDAALFASDFRAPERLFALLMQAAGRAGRDAGIAARSEMWIQTWHPRHALYAALGRHDYAQFASGQLEERASAGLPPFSHLALLRAEAREASTRGSFPARSRRGGARAAGGRAAPWCTRPCRRRCRAWPTWSGCRCSWSRARASRCSACSPHGCRSCTRCAPRTRACCAGPSTSTR